jgi:hypothetical protein
MIQLLSSQSSTFEPKVQEALGGGNGGSGCDRDGHVGGENESEENE